MHSAVASRNLEKAIQQYKQLKTTKIPREKNWVIYCHIFFLLGRGLFYDTVSRLQHRMVRRVMTVEIERIGKEAAVA
jgi:hypothetical protein